MTITISPEVADRVEKAAAEKLQDPSQYVDFLLNKALPQVSQADDDQPPPYVRPTEPPAWVLELIAQKRAEVGDYPMRRVWGAWPGDETDEQINAALEELS